MAELYRLWVVHDRRLVGTEKGAVSAQKIKEKNAIALPIFAS